MNAAENRRRIARLRAGESFKGGAVSSHPLADSAELLYAAKLYPRIGNPAPAGEGGRPRRLELRRG